MTDPASAFLHRKERQAVQRKLKKGEKPRTMVAAVHRGRHGLLCSTKSRILFAARKGMGTKVWDWPRSAITGVATKKERYGTVVLKTKKETLRFEMTQRGDAQAFMQTLAPPQRPRPKKAKSTGQARATVRQRPPPVRPKLAPEPEPDALAHRDSAAHKQRLQRMLEKGVITKREYEWQVESIRA